MCIAIAAPAGKVIDEETLHQCFLNNDDGCGFAYINVNDKGKRHIKIKKNMLFKDFYPRYVKATKANPDSPFLIHFRISTHGKVNINNCHPFKINHDQAFIHNGVISKAKDDPKKERNDTQMFCEEYLQTFPKGWEKSEGLLKMLNDYIGASKFAILNIDGDITFVNESAGHWEDGIWWSNFSYKDNTRFSKWNGNKVTTYKNCNQAHNSHVNTDYYANMRNKQGAFHGITDEMEEQLKRDKLREAIQSSRTKADGKYESTIPKHTHEELELLEQDDYLPECIEENTDGLDYEPCEVCMQPEVGYLVTTVMLDGVYYNLCRDCLRLLDDSDMVYYEHLIKPGTEIYLELYPNDDDNVNDSYNVAGDDVPTNWM